MKLNIFFTNKADRIKFLNIELNIKDIDINNKKVLSYKIDGVYSLKFKNSFGKVPGYWIEFDFNENKDGNDLYNRLRNTSPVSNQNNNVFYPTNNNLSSRELSSEWINKYNFSIEDRAEDKWRLFFKEIKSHIKYGRMDIAFYGLNFGLKYNPFFFKKYRRSYLFEELAYYYEEQGNLTRAIKCLKLQSVLNPESVEPYLNMSSFYIINGLEEDAIQICKKGLEKSPQDQYLISNLVIALCNIENYDFALIFLKKVLEEDKENKLFWKLMGDIYYETENNEDATRCYNKALSIKQNNEDDMNNFYMDLYSSIGTCYFEEEKYSDAVKCYEKVLACNSDDAYILLSLSQIYFYYLKDIDIALKYTNLLVDQAPDSGFGQYQLGLIHFEQGNTEKARWHLYKARRIMPDYGPVHDAIEIIKTSSNLAK